MVVTSLWHAMMTIYVFTLVFFLLKGSLHGPISPVCRLTLLMSARVRHTHPQEKCPQVLLEALFKFHTDHISLHQKTVSLVIKALLEQNAFQQSLKTFCVIYVKRVYLMLCKIIHKCTTKCTNINKKEAAKPQHYHFETQCN